MLAAIPSGNKNQGVYFFDDQLGDDAKTQMRQSNNDKPARSPLPVEIDVLAGLGRQK